MSLQGAQQGFSKQFIELDSVESPLILSGSGKGVFGERCANNGALGIMCESVDFDHIGVLKILFLLGYYNVFGILLLRESRNELHN
jgi:hypothetical protein